MHRTGAGAFWNYRTGFPYPYLYGRDYPLPLVEKHNINRNLNEEYNKQVGTNVADILLLNEMARKEAEEEQDWLLGIEQKVMDQKWGYKGLWVLFLIVIVLCVYFMNYSS